MSMLYVESKSCQLRGPHVNAVCRMPVVTSLANCYNVSTVRRISIGSNNLNSHSCLDLKALLINPQSIIIVSYLLVAVRCHNNKTG